MKICDVWRAVLRARELAKNAEKLDFEGERPVSPTSIF